MSIISHIYVFDVFEVNESAQTVQCESRPIDLTNAEFKLLLFFVKNKQAVYGYNELYEEVFGLEGKSQENTIPTHISNLRTKLRRCSDNKLFKNIPNTGYRFEAEVSIKKKVDYQPEAKISAGRLNNSPVKKVLVGMFAAIIITVFVVFYLTKNGLGKKIPPPHLIRMELVSQPIPDQQIYLKIDGANINPSSVKLKVTGPGCGEDEPCTVPNGVLRLYGVIDENQIEKVPVTLTSGEYRIWIENETGVSSNKATLIIPETAPD